MDKLRVGIAAKLSVIEWDMHSLGLSWDQVISSDEGQK